MCDQTELPYSSGDIVWVKLGPVWWPGQVQDYEKLPEEITGNLRKKPIAVVKFFQEESFEYVKNINHIYHYNCRKKHEFIKKGLDLCRSSNSRDVPSNMNLFPNDIATAEHLTGGNPNIIKDEEFAPEEKADYSELFGAKKTSGKKLKTDSIKKEYSGWRLKHLKETSLKNGRRSLPATPPRAITHPRFINKAFHGQSDHEIRIRYQATTPLREDDPVGSSPQKQYNCHICGFTSSRLNVIILHNKSHSAGFSDSYLATSAIQLKKPKLKDYSVPTAVVKSRVKSTPRRLLLGLDSPKRKKEKSPKETKIETPEEGPVTSTPKKDKVEEKTPVKKTESVKRKSAKDKKPNSSKKVENEAIRETLLKDWDEDDDVQAEAEIEGIKQINDDKPEEEKVEEEKPEQVKTGQSRLLGKRSIRLGKTLGNKEDPNKAKETSCFDFDDSDEGIRLDGTVMKFGMKIPRVLGDDKTKRKSLDVETIEQIGAVKNEKESKEAEEDKKLETEFESLLEETAVPVIPDVPKNLPTINTFCNESSFSGVQDIEISNLASTETDTSQGAAENDLTSMEVDCSSVKENKDENVDKISETDVENNPMCNVTGVTSINKDEFDSVVDNDLENQVTVKSESDVIDSAKTIETSEFEPNLENTTQKQSEFEVSQFTPEIETVSTEKTEEEENKSEEYIEFKINSEIPPDCRPTGNLETGETVGTQDISMECDSQYVSDQERAQKIEISSDVVTVKDEDIESSTVKVESDSLENEASSKAKMDLEHIVNDIYIEETITATEESESNVEVMSEPVVTETIQSKTPGQTETEKNTSVQVTESEKFQDVPFDINAMPVIIGEDFMPEETKPIILNPSKATTSGDIVKPSKATTSSDITQNRNVIMISNQSSSGNEVGSKVLQSVISVAGKEGQIITSKSLANKSLTTVKTINIPQGSPLSKLKSVPGFSKSGSNQVLILKTASGQSSKIAVNKSNLQKLGTQQIIQQGGGKVLILTNPQGSGQGKISTLTSQQVLTSGGKLPPGTRLITSKGTVLSTSGAQTVTLGKSVAQKTKATPKYVISKGNLLSTTSKNMMIGKSGILTPITSTTTKGQSFITQNVVTSKGSLIIPSSSAMSKSPSVMTQAITTSKGMILTPMTSKGIITGNQKVRIVSSTAPMTLPSGARFVVQNPQSKLVTIPQQKNQKLKIVTKGQPSGSTLLIQTSQGHPTLLTSNQITTKPKLIPLSKSLPSISPQIVPRLTVPQTQPQILTKKVVQKVRQASPNILQKSQKKPTPRGQKGYQNRLISPQQTVSQETILMPAGLPVVDQSMIKTGIPQGDGTALVYLAVDEAGNYRPLSDNSLVSFEGTQQQDARTLYIDSGTTDMDNIFLTIDDAGNVVNISQPAPPTFTSESSLPSQDILAKALANTQVLQPETILPDSIPSSIVSSSLDHTTINSSFAEQAHYPAPSLSHSVLETSLTLNQPIMTPLEVPSAVSSSNLSRITSLPSSFIHSNLLNQKTQLIRPSMPLLTEETDNSPQPEPVYLLDSAHNIIAPVTSGSLSLQLTLNDNVIVSSQGGTSLIPSTYQVVTTNVLTSPAYSDPNNFKSENTVVTSLNDSVQSPFIIQSDQNEIIIPSGYDTQEQSESPHITTDFLNDVESKHDIKQEVVSESVDEHSNPVEMVEPNNYLNDEIEKPLLKRSSEGDSDMKTESSPKRVKIDER